MKKFFTTVLVIFAFVLNAQNTCADKTIQSPIYEKVDDLVKVTHFYETGEIKEQGFYDSDNKLTGKWLQFDKQGKKTTVAHYYKGAKVGKWFVWKGDKLLELDYEASRIANVNEWQGSETVIADN
jgi:antitoxin component YwqK of YwqJK toxin-antitoxin module